MSQLAKFYTISTVWLHRLYLCIFYNSPIDKPLGESDRAEDEKCADDNPGHSVFDESGKAVYTKAAAFRPYLVRVSIPDLNIRQAPGTDQPRTGKYTDIGTFTIVDEADGKGASRWGLLKSYQEKRDGWISLDHTSRV